MNIRSTLGGGILLYVTETFQANKLKSFSEVYEYLKTTLVSFSVGEVHLVIVNVSCPPNSHNDEFICDTSNIMNTALTKFSKFYFLYIW